MAAVVGWGDIEVHRSGWRAQHAQVVAIARSERSAGPARAAARYRVPLVDRSDLERVALEHGRPTCASERPDRRDAGRYAAAVTRALLGGPRSRPLIALGLLAPLTFTLTGLARSLPVFLASVILVAVAGALLAGNLFLVGGQWPLCRTVRRRARLVNLVVVGALITALSASFAIHVP